MKKQIIMTGMALLTLPMFAAVENVSYGSYDGLTCTNLYNISRAYSQDEFLATPMAEFNNKTRSMVVRDGKLYIAESRTMSDGDENNDFGHLIVVDRNTGVVEGRVQLTVNGEPLKGLLCANQIGVDDYGNIWIMGLIGNSETTPFRLYHVKDVVSGDTELVAELYLPEDEMDAVGRHDYFDVVGDVTGAQAGTVIMSPVASGDNTYVVGFERDQNSEDWSGHMEGYCWSTMGETYPADLISWDGAPMVRIVRDEDSSGELYYIDAFVSYPTLYNIEGGMLDSFVNVPSELRPQTNSNGVNEFSFAGKNFMVYTNTDYDKGVGTQVRVVELGPDMAFEGMQLAWDLPKGGLGTLTDTGSRMMGICPDVVTDANGKQACYLSLYKCNGGLATYLLAEPGFESGVESIEADTTTGATEYFNLQGVRVDSPAAGSVVIARQGSTVTKMVVK
ncbi:MAG: hypothetical protein J1F20_04985 [Muribaculaceae bacterium]|nr:hypothetical protein [Muribaculaceae bacterium]